MSKYEIKKRREFLEHVITELNVARDNLKILDKKLVEYLLGTRGKIYEAGEYILKEKELVVGRIKYMENFIGNAD